jgi:lipid-A-disaccharide synthase
MIKAAAHFQDFQIVISKVSNLPIDIYPNEMGYIITEDFNNLISYADYAFVTSGTASLDLAIAGVPQIVMYKSSWISMTIAKALVKVNYISLVNLICNRKVVVELIQEKATESALIECMAALVNESHNINSKIYTDLYAKLKKQESTHSAADMILQLANNK